MRGEQEEDTSFAALRRLRWPEPDPALRDRCLPPELRRALADIKTRTILVVEDEPAIRQLIPLHLTRARYAVIEARDGREALECVRAGAPDLILLDVMMPGPNGFEVLRALRDDPATLETPVVMLTARGSDDHVRRGWQKGVDYYMPKPFNPTELLMWVRRVLENPGPAAEGGGRYQL